MGDFEQLAWMNVDYMEQHVFAGKLPEGQVRPTQCGLGHVYVEVKYCFTWLEIAFKDRTQYFCMLF